MSILIKAPATNPFYQLPPDEVRHLAAYLDETGRHSDLHRLVNYNWEKEGKNVNGWYLIHEHHGDVSGFLSDVRRAWAAAERAVDDSAAFISLACRYALICSSMVSLSGNVSAVVVASMVKEGRWTPLQGLYYARNSPDMAERARVLAFIAPMLSKEDYKSALELALEIKEPISRFWALVGLVHHLGDTVAALQVLLQAISQVDDLWLRAQCLAGMALLQPRPLASLLLSASTAVVDQICLTQSKRSEGDAEKSPVEIKSAQREAAKTRAKLLAALCAMLGEAGQFGAAIDVAAMAWNPRNKWAGISSRATIVRRFLYFFPMLLLTRVDRCRRIPQQLHDLLENFNWPRIMWNEKGQMDLEKIPAIYAVNMINSVEKRLKEEIAKPLLPWFQKYELIQIRGMNFWELGGYGILILRVELPDGTEAHPQSVFPVMLTWLAQEGGMGEASTITKLLGFRSILMDLFKAPGRLFSVRKIYNLSAWFFSPWQIFSDLVCKVHGIAIFVGSYCYSRTQRTLGIWNARLLSRCPSTWKRILEQSVVEGIRETRVPWDQMTLIQHCYAGLSNEAKKEVERLAESIQPPKYRARSMASIAVSLPKEDQPAKFAEVLDSISNIVNQFDRAEVLALLPKTMPTDLRARAVEMAWRLQNPFARAQALAGLGLKFEQSDTQLGFDGPLKGIGDEEQIARSLALLSPFLSGNLLRVATKQLERIHRDQGGDDAKREVSVRLAQLGQTEAAIDVALTITDRVCCVKTIAKMMPFLSGAAADYASARALLAAKDIIDEEQAARAIIEFAPHATGGMIEEVTHIATLRIGQARTDALQAELLGNLAHVLSDMTNDEMQGRLLWAALRIKDDNARDKALASISVILARKQNSALLTTAIGRILSVDSLCRSISAFASVIGGVPLPELLILLSRIDVPRQRAEVIASLLPHVGASTKNVLLKEGMQACRQVKNPYDVIQALLGLARFDLAAAEVALHAIQKHPPGRLRVMFLARLGHIFPNNEPQHVLSLFIHELRSVASPLEQARLFSELVTTSNSGDPVFLHGWPDSVRAEALQLFLSANCSIENAKERAEHLLLLADYLPSDLAHNCIDMALNVAISIPNPVERVSTLAMISRKSGTHAEEAIAAGRLAIKQIHNSSEQAQATAQICPSAEALEAAATLPGAKSRAKAMVDVFCRTEIDNKDKALDFLCGGTDRFPDPADRSAAKLATIERLTEKNEFAAAFRVFMTLQGGDARRTGCKTLRPYFNTANARECLPHFKRWLEILSHQKRSELLAEICETAPLFHCLDESLPGQIAEAILDVHQWWP